MSLYPNSSAVFMNTKIVCIDTNCAQDSQCIRFKIKKEAKRKTKQLIQYHYPDNNYYYSSQYYNHYLYDEP